MEQRGATGKGVVYNEKSMRLERWEAVELKNAKAGPRSRRIRQRIHRRACGAGEACVSWFLQHEKVLKYLYRVGRRLGAAA
jgi:hypothetical protein